MSFRLKLFLSQLAVILAVVWGLDFFIARGLKHRLLEDMQRDLSRHAAAIGEFLRQEPGPLPADAYLDSVADRLGHVLGLRVTLINAEGVVMGDSDVEADLLPSIENHLYRPEVQKALREGSGRSVRYSTTVRNDLIYVAWRNSDQDGPVKIIRLAAELSRYRETLVRWRKVVAAASVVGVLIAAAVAMWIARRFGDRVTRLAEFTERVASGAPASPLLISPRNDELGRLGASLEKMALVIREKMVALAGESIRRETILRAMEEGIAAWSIDGRLILANPAFDRIFGRGESAPSSSPVESLGNNQAMELYDRTLRERAPSEGEILLPSTRTRIFCRFTPILEPGSPNSNGRGLEGVLGVFQDVTQLRRLEEVRRDFVLNAAHELKTPLSSILGYSETLIGGAASDPVNGPHFLERIRANANRLGRIVDDLLTLGRIESGAWPLEIKPIRLGELIQRILATLRPDIERRRVQTRVEVAESAHVLDADEFALEQILLNLLENATKYNREGGSITIRAATEGSRSAIEIKDTGIGIPPEDQGRIFERFYRVDKARSREMGGTGLGLSIVKHLVSAHGGEVSIQSEPGRGSCFTVTLPVQPPSKS